MWKRGCGGVSNLLITHETHLATLCLRMCVCVWAGVKSSPQFWITLSFAFWFCRDQQHTGERRKWKESAAVSSEMQNVFLLRFAQQVTVAPKVLFIYFRLSPHSHTHSLSRTHTCGDIARRHWKLLPSQSKVKQSSAVAVQSLLSQSSAARVAASVSIAATAAALQPSEPSAPQPVGSFEP